MYWKVLWKNQWKIYGYKETRSIQLRYPVLQISKWKYLPLLCGKKMRLAALWFHDFIIKPAWCIVDILKANTQHLKAWWQVLSWRSVYQGYFLSSASRTEADNESTSVTIHGESFPKGAHEVLHIFVGSVYAIFRQMPYLDFVWEIPLRVYRWLLILFEAVVIANWNIELFWLRCHGGFDASKNMIHDDNAKRPQSILQNMWNTTYDEADCAKRLDKISICSVCICFESCIRMSGWKKAST